MEVEKDLCPAFGGGFDGSGGYTVPTTTLGRPVVNIPSENSPKIQYELLHLDSLQHTNRFGNVFGN